MCGFIGVIRPRQNVFPEIYDGLVCLQHRGQDSAGAVTFVDGQFQMKRGQGLVRDVFTEKNFLRMQGNVGLGHVRYPTVGLGRLEDTQPFVINYPFGIAMVHNGNVSNCSSLREELAQQRHYIGSTCDVELILNVLGEELSSKARGAELTPQDIFDAVENVLARVKGAYSVAAHIAGHGLVGFRDPYGIRPMLIGKRDEDEGTAWAMASEQVALDFMGYGEPRDVAPGEVVFIRQNGEMFSRQLTSKPHRPCIFEHIYFARPDSMIDQISVYKTRLRMGQRLAKRWETTGLKADVVMPVPDSARTASVAMASALGIPYREGFVKNRYVGRTFIMKDQVTRKQSVRHKLNTIPLEFEGKDVLIVDDSIVRGNTSRTIVQMAREAGANKVYLASYSSPVKYPCVYGIDMSTRSEFIARKNEFDEIRAAIGCDYLIYQDIPDMAEAAREGNPNIERFCMACFDGEYPTEDVTPEMLAAIETERLAAHG
ncbi:MAG: amidophosphoribosyltransferase [Planctomycetota bacterium]